MPDRQHAPHETHDRPTDGASSSLVVEPTGASPDGQPAPEADTVLLPVTATRASLRAAREAAAAAAHRAPDTVVAQVEAPTRAVTVVVTIALAVLLGASALAGQVETGAAVAFAGVVLAAGWPLLLDAPTPQWATLVIGASGVAIALTAGLTLDGDLLRWVPAAIGVSMVIGFLQQLLRRERSRLTLGIASTVAAIALATAGTPVAVLPAFPRGASHLIVAAAALAATVVAELLGRIPGVQRWLLVPAVVVGTGGAVVASLLVTGVSLRAALLLGVVVAGISHIVRRVLSPLPGAATVAGQLSVAAASVLSVGVVVYLVTRVLVA